MRQKKTLEWSAESWPVKRSLWTRHSYFILNIFDWFSFKILIFVLNFDFRFLFFRFQLERPFVHFHFRSDVRRRLRHFLFTSTPASGWPTIAETSSGRESIRKTTSELGNNDDIDQVLIVIIAASVFIRSDKFNND